jgi:hypothetical protein
VEEWCAIDRVSTLLEVPSCDGAARGIWNNNFQGERITRGAVSDEAKSSRLFQAECLVYPEREGNYR